MFFGKAVQKGENSKIPDLIFERKDYHNIMSWKSNDVTELPATTAISDPELDNHIAAKHLFEVGRYPLHTQAVERAIKVVSETSSQVCGQET